VSLEDIAPLLETAESYLSGLPERETGLAIAQIAQIRAEWGVAGEVPPADEAMRLSQARGRLMQARSYALAGRPDLVDIALAEATGHLDGVGPAATAALLAEIEDVRAERDAAPHDAGAELERELAAAEAHIPAEPRLVSAALKRFADCIAAAEVRAALPPETVERYMARAVELTTRLAASIKERALGSALPPLAELEQRLGTDPYARLDQRAAHTVSAELRELKHRVLAAIGHLPADDPDVRDIHARMVSADRAHDRAWSARGMVVLAEPVTNSWPAIRDDTEGWTDELATPGLLEEPDLPKTRAAIQRARHLLAGADPAGPDPDDPADLDPDDRAAARLLLTAAATRMRQAYLRVLDEAERLPTPLRGVELGRAGRLAIAAGYTFAGTNHAGSVTARARELDARWQAEAAAALRARQHVYDTLAAEALAAWPRIVAATGARDGFDPADESTRGRTVLVPAVHNRAGWDFSDHDFAMRHQGVAVGGSYEPHVLRALEHAWYDLRLDVDEQAPWDLVAIVEGPGKLGERTLVTMTDRVTGAEVGKREEWRPVDCVRLRIIALRAGIVAVGPGRPDHR
jgi:hypothetical protein